jgi:hypothetical protein
LGIGSQYLITRNYRLDGKNKYHPVVMIVAKKPLELMMVVDLEKLPPG